MFYKKIDFEPSLKSGWKVVVFIYVKFVLSLFPI